MKKEKENQREPRATTTMALASHREYGNMPFLATNYPLRQHRQH